MKKILYFIICLSLIICSCSNPKKNQKLYNIFIGTNATGFDDDSFARAGGKDIKGGVYIFINENPICYYGGFGKAIQVNHWLKTNKNTIHIKGSSSKDIYLKIASMNFKGENFKTIFKKHIVAGDIEIKSFFHLDLNYQLPLFNNSIMYENKDIIKNEIKDTVMILKNNIENRNKEKLIDQLLTGPSIWQTIAYNINWMDNKQFFEDRITEEYVKGTKKIIDFDKNDIKYIFGENAVYVYTGHSDDVLSDTYLFKFSEKEKNDFLPAIKVIKYQDKWIIWQ